MVMGMPLPCMACPIKRQPSVPLMAHAERLDLGAGEAEAEGDCIHGM
jgi:hypothetical protein